MNNTDKSMPKESSDSKVLSWIRTVIDGDYNFK